jgi:glycerate kinase
MGPLGAPVSAAFGYSAARSLAVVELAQAAGLSLIKPADRNPLNTTTFGVGQLIHHAIQLGARHIIVAVGGSATVDAGAAIAQALGIKFFDSHGCEITAPITAAHLAKIARIDATAFQLTSSIRVACDVTNPLCGPHGSALTYGSQKGAPPPLQRELDLALQHFANVCETHDFPVNTNAPGAGAAGGAAFGLATLCNAILERGIDLVLDAINFRERCQGATLILTGEGQLDAQSLQGKATLGVAASAALLQIPTIAIAGTTGPGAQDTTNPARGGHLQSYISLAERFSPEQAMHNPAELIAQVAAEIVRELRADPPPDADQRSA